MLWACWLGLGASVGCAARGHVATPDEMARLRQAGGLSASGRITLKGPAAGFSTRLLFGVSEPDSLRLEIASGAGLRFLLLSAAGRLRAELPLDDAMFEGPATREVMNGMFGVDLDPKDLVRAILGSPPPAFQAGWRFDRTLPAQITLRGPNRKRLSLTLDEVDLQSPGSQAFEFGPPRGQSWTLPQMSQRLGLRR